jgi:hypothetical protein
MIIGAVLLLIAASPVVNTVTPPKSVQKLLVPVLDASARVRSEGETLATLVALDTALDRVLFDRSSVGDEALSILLGVYIGEQPGDVPRPVESRRRFRPNIYATFSCVSSEFLLTTASSAAIS